MPTNYTVKFLIGAILTDSSSNIRLFEVYDGGDVVEYVDLPPNIGSTALGTTPVGYSVPAPPKSELDFNISITNTAQTAAVWVYDGDHTLPGAAAFASSP